MAKVEDAKIGAGNVEITLAGEKRILKPTFRAASALSQEYGGLANIITRVSKVEMSVVASVIEHGLGLTEEGKKSLDEKIFQSGIASLVGPCVKYVIILTNGGQPHKVAKEGEGEAPLGENG